MSVTQVGAHSVDSVASGTSVSPAKPTGVAQGDVLIASVTQNNQTVTAPSGWVKFEDRNASGTTGDVWASSLWYKVAGASEPSTYTFSVPSAAPFVVSLDAWRGCDIVNGPIDSGHASTISGSLAEPHTGPSTTVTVADGLLFFVRAVRVVSSTVPTLSSTDGTVTRHWSEGIFSGGTVSYAHAQWTKTADFSGTGTYTGLSTSCSGSEADNFEATFALVAASTASSGDDSGSATESASLKVTAVTDTGSGVDVGVHTLPVDFGTGADNAIIGTAHNAVTDSFTGHEAATAGIVGSISDKPRVSTVDLENRTFTVAADTRILKVRATASRPPSTAVFPVEMRVTDAVSVVDFAVIGNAVQAASDAATGVEFAPPFTTLIPSSDAATAVDAANALTGGLVKYVISIGDGTNTTYTVNHNFGSRDVMVRTYDATTYEEVKAKVAHSTTNAVSVTFAAAPAANSYRVVVLYST